MNTFQIYLSAVLVLAAATLGTAAAQAPPPAEVAQAAVTAPPPAQTGLSVGDATTQLLQLQRQSKGVDRPIPGEQASLSYQRYLESFKHPIPAQLGSSVKANKSD
jgi:hypothetical protein